MSRLASLPQDDKNTSARRSYLAKMRQQYAYQYSYNNTFATVIKLPTAQKADCCYQFAAIRNLLPLLLRLPNIIMAKLKHRFKVPIKSFSDYLFFGRTSFPDTRYLTNFLSDEYFGLQRVIGVNHVLLQGASAQKTLPEKLALERIKAVFPELVTAMSFDEALQNERLYYLDYAMLQGLVDNPGTYDNRKQYVTAPIVLLYRQSDGTLRPVAIQLNQTPSDMNPVFTPLDNAWNAAKLYAQIADINYQEFVTHATQIHYLMESFIIATYRELYKTHPVFLLLKSHLSYTLSVNAHHLFLKNKKGVPGYFGAQLGGDYDSMVALMAEAFKTYDFTNSALPTDVVERGVDNSELYYPYAHQGKQIWEMTYQFVHDYLSLYYPDGKNLAEDTEIQSWARVIASDNGMRVKGFPSQFDNLEQLVQAVAHIIFISTAKHATIHYPQYQFSGYIPGMPFAAYEPAPTQVDIEYSEKDLLAILPLREPAMSQSFTFYLTNFRLGHIGEYKTLDAKAQPLVEKYQQQLAELAQQMSDAEVGEAYPYMYLNPKYIPGSVMV